MKNTTTLKVPAKYAMNLELVEQDGDGYWAYTNHGFQFEEMGCHTAHEFSQKDLLDVIRTIIPCDCKECEKGLKNQEATNITEEFAEHQETILGALDITYRNRANRIISHEQHIQRPQTQRNPIEMEKWLGAIAKLKKRNEELLAAIEFVKKNGGGTQ